jgi:hypothetical protein
MQKKNRWYDKYKELAELLERFKGMRRTVRDRYVAGVMATVKAAAPDLLEKNVMKYPLELQRRRWYDKDPYLWLIFNGLRYAEIDLLKSVTRFLETELNHK